MGSVNSGAEAGRAACAHDWEAHTTAWQVLADGDIYIYGALRGPGTLTPNPVSGLESKPCYGSFEGRAMAGRDGNSDSKVFASQFEAELVGIANAFAVCEENPAGVEECRPTMVWLEVLHLCMTWPRA